MTNPLDKYGTVDAYDYIFELGQRFPDMTDDAVCTAYEEYTSVPYLNPKSFVGALILQCYIQGTNTPLTVEQG
jgi:hypothetical protein